MHAYRKVILLHLSSFVLAPDYIFLQLKALYSEQRGCKPVVAFGKFIIPVPNITRTPDTMSFVKRASSLGGTIVPGINLQKRFAWLRSGSIPAGTALWC